MPHFPDQPVVLLFGLPADRGRWLLIPLGMVMLLCLGTVYAWSMFRKPLEAELAMGATQSLVPYAVALVCDATLMPIAGRSMERIGVRTMAAAGGVLVGCGYLLASFAHSLGGLVLTYGVINGAGAGMAYGVPLLVVARWFPDRKGLAVGLTLLGFGLSPMLTAPLANQLIAHFGVRPTLRLLAGGFAVLIVAVSSAFQLPPRSWRPPGVPAAAPAAAAPAAEGGGRSRLPPLLHSRAFRGLWLSFLLVSLVGISAVGISGQVGEELIQITPTAAARSMALFALFNGISRPLFGWLTDRYRPQQVAVASFGLILVACLLMIHARAGQELTYLIAFSLFWFCLGGWLALAPTATLRLFDPDHYAQNYGLVSTAFGIGALVGTLLAGQMRDGLGSYAYGFYPMALLAVLGIGVAIWWLKPETPSAP